MDVDTNVDAARVDACATSATILGDGTKIAGNVTVWRA
jgi:hypothetical protein